MKNIILIILLLCLGATSAHAVQPDEILADAALEKRARQISRQLRCLVCQGEDIDESAAGLARDLRLLVRERLVAGDSDEAVLSFIQARYGDYVLMNPPFKPQTFLLWLTPLLVLLGGFAFVARHVQLGKSARRKAEDA
jgi:cytochrome c-type biogenesis protein CcmH